MKKKLSQNLINNNNITRTNNRLKREFSENRLRAINNCNKTVDEVITIDKDILFELMLMAHEQDITFNELINNILRDYIKTYEGINNDNR